MNTYAQNGYQPIGVANQMSAPPTVGTGMQPYAPPQYNTQTNNIIWVQGIEGARAYNVAPNSAVPLWDSESNTIYLKMTDASGIPQPIRTFDYIERAQTEDKKDYVTADDVAAIMDSKINALTVQIEQMLKESRPYQKKGGKYNGKPTVQPSES